MIKALIGNTGFVGSSHSQDNYTHLINSSNISSYAGLEVDLMVVAAGDARKWFANKNPEKDWEHILKLYRDLTAIRAKHVILYSTVDVLDTTMGIANEDSTHFNFHPYGRHRLLLELMLARFFDKLQVVRLPGLFGKGLKKNIIYDIKNNRTDQFGAYNPSSAFQYFNMKYADTLIENIIASRLPLIHITSEPITVSDLFNVADPKHKNLTNPSSSLVIYNFQSKFLAINPSPAGKEATLKEIVDYINHESC